MAVEVSPCNNLQLLAREFQNDYSKTSRASFDRKGKSSPITPRASSFGQDNDKKKKEKENSVTYHDKTVRLMQASTICFICRRYSRRS